MSHGWTDENTEAARRESDAERKKMVDKAMQTMDAAVWARAFVAHAHHNIHIAIDEATMTGWFANAIMCGFDQKGRKAA